MTASLLARALVVIVSAALATPVFAQMGGVQMPDIRQMSGIPLPAGDLGDGVVSVRLVRGALSNNIVGHEVQLVVDGRTISATTNDTGRAEFMNLIAGATAQAVATVDGQRLESQGFPVPAKGGVRLMLVASVDGDTGDPAGGPTQPPAQGAPPPAPVAADAQPGTVTLGGDSRVVIEMGDDGLQVFYLFDIVNNSTTPVRPPSALLFDMPTGAVATTVLQESTVEANANGPRVSVPGPFPPGRSSLQIAYRLSHGGPDVSLAQTFPVPLEHVSVIAQKVGDMHLGSPQIANHRDMPASGFTYIVGQGPGLPAGGTLQLELTGLPHHSRTPRYLALTLALGVLAAGFWFAFAGTGDQGTPRRRLAARREALFAELVKLEERRHGGTVDGARYATRRRALVTQLERIYGELDQEPASTIFTAQASSARSRRAEPVRQ